MTKFQIIDSYVTYFKILFKCCSISSKRYIFALHWRVVRQVLPQMLLNFSSFEYSIKP